MWGEGSIFLFFGGEESKVLRGGGSKSLDFNIATVKRYGASRLVAKSPFSKKRQSIWRQSPYRQSLIIPSRVRIKVHRIASGKDHHQHQVQ